MSGLAKSSRNNYLSREEKKKAALIRKTLINLKQLLLDFNGIDSVIQQAKESLEKNDFNVDVKKGDVVRANISKIGSFNA